MDSAQVNVADRTKPRRSASGASGTSRGALIGFELRRVVKMLRRRPLKTERRIDLR